MVNEVKAGWDEVKRSVVDEKEGKVQKATAEEVKNVESAVWVPPVCRRVIYIVCVQTVNNNR